MYYELISGQWGQNNRKSVLFNGDTIPVTDDMPGDFWNVERMPAAPVPVYDATTHKLAGPQVIGETVGYVKEPLTPAELAANLEVERAGMILSPWQFRKAINAANKRVIVEGALSSMTQDEQDGWHVASSFERLNPLVVKLGGELLGYDDNQLDNFFRNAAEL